MVLAADIVHLDPAATITPYYADVGFTPDGGWTAMMPAVIGRDRPFDVLVRNRTIDADTAVAWGIAASAVGAPVDTVWDTPMPFHRGQEAVRGGRKNCCANETGLIGGSNENGPPSWRKYSVPKSSPGSNVSWKCEAQPIRTRHRSV